MQLAPLVIRPPARPTVYVVQAGDSPTRIAARYGVPAWRANELVPANPRKPRKVQNGVATFQTLQIGERIFIPNAWVKTTNPCPPGQHPGPNPDPNSVSPTICLPDYSPCPYGFAHNASGHCVPVSVPYLGRRGLGANRLPARSRTPVDRHGRPRSLAFYTVQRGNTVSSIVEGFGLPPHRSYELIVVNRHKPFIRRGNQYFFKDLLVGERLWLPNSWLRQQQVGVGAFWDDIDITDPIICPDGFSRNHDTGKCDADPFVPCPPGQHHDGPNCVNEVQCPAGFHADFSGTTCLPDTPADHSVGAVPKFGTCPTGYIDDPVNPKDFCILNPNTDTNCPPGQVFDVFLLQCVNVNCDASLDPNCNPNGIHCPFGQHPENGVCVSNEGAPPEIIPVQTPPPCPTGTRRNASGACVAIVGPGPGPVTTVPPVVIPPIVIPPDDCPQGFARNMSPSNIPGAPSVPGPCVPVPVPAKDNGISPWLLAGGAALLAGGAYVVATSKKKKGRR